MKTPREFAIRSREILKQDYDNEDMRELITETMVGFGEIDEWIDVFRDDSDMVQRFRDAEHRIRCREPLLVDLII